MIVLSYLTAKVQPGAIASVVQATGTINPLTMVPVGSNVSDTVQYVFADFNSQVQTGQVPAQSDPQVHEAAVTQARGNPDNAVADQKSLEVSLAVGQAAIETNRANLERLKAAAMYSRVNTKRILDLADQGVLSRD